MTGRGDAWGSLLLDALDHGGVVEVVERDDGFVDSSGGLLGLYFAPFRRWPPHERRAMRFVRGRVLDVGCGAGRVCLHLQQLGRDVVGIDAAPGAVEVCRRRGVRDARVVRLEQVDRSLGEFDTILMYGNNLALLGDEDKARRILRRLHEVSSSRGRIVGSTLDPYGTEDPAHLAYHERNRRRGRSGGQIRIRVRYRDLAAPWFDLLFTSVAELETILAGTGWRLARTIDGPGPLYAAVIDKLSNA